MIDLSVVWIICGIFSCLIFNLSCRDLVRGIDLTDAMVLVVFYIVFIIAGPIGLALMLAARLVMFLGNL